MIRVAITEDHPDMRDALRLLLDQSGDVELIYETDNGQGAVECASRLKPDVLVMAVNLPGMDGFDAARRIHDLPVPTRVILISLDSGSFVVRQAAEVGAQGFVAKDNAAQQLLSAIRTVYRGETYFVE